MVGRICSHWAFLPLVGTNPLLFAMFKTCLTFWGGKDYCAGMGRSLYEQPEKAIQEIAKGLVSSIMPVKVILADEDKTKLIFSEKEASWSKFSKQVKGLYHLTGLIHISEVSWDLVQDVRDFLTEGDEVRVKVINIDRWKKSRITLSIKQLEEDPLLETLDKVIPQDGLADSDSLSGSGSSDIEPLQGLETIFEELLQEDG
ncbi:hypothetical protein OROGR_001616 [Orobanche gracilis]